MRTLTIIDCTFAANSAVGGSGGSQYPGQPGAGAICNTSSGQATITNTTFANSHGAGAAGTSSGAAAGAIVNNGAVTFTSCTFSGNSADGPGTQAGAINTIGGSVILQNTLVAGNSATTGAPDLNGSFISQGYNLVGDGSGAIGVGHATGDKVGGPSNPVDPKLAPLADNGGGILTFALLAGSPAIDAGFSFTVNTDERGAMRPSDDPSLPNAAGGDGSDIGPFELQHTPMPTATPTPTATPAPTATDTATATPTATATATPPSQLQTFRHGKRSAQEITCSSAALSSSGAKISKSYCVDSDLACRWMAL